MDKTNIFLNNKYLKENMADTETDKYPIIFIESEQELEQELQLEQEPELEQEIA